MDITEYKVTKDGFKTIVTGMFAASGGSFEVKFQGDGGNADAYEFKLWGGQFDMDGKPTEFTIIGAWEFGEVLGIMRLINKLR